MVVIEESSEHRKPEAGRGPSVVSGTAAIIITGAGWEDANGLYSPTGRTWHDAPIYENDQKCLLSREPHRNQKTGETSYGWIIGQDRKPLYAIQAEGLAPPCSGWRKFSGTLPAPQLQGAATLEEAARAAGQAWKEQGNKLFAARRYGEADARWTRALSFLGSLGEDTLQVALYSNRAEARLRQRLWEPALLDAEAALKRKPTHDKALLRAAVAAREMGRLDQAQDFAQRCLDAHPQQPEAEQLMMDLEQQIDAAPKDFAWKAKSARTKLQEALRKEAAQGDLADIPKALAAKDQNSRKGFKAFAGYSEKRKAPEERPPLSSLPYHHMGLPQDQVELMDKFFKESREKRDAAERIAREERQSYEELKQEYRERAQQDVAAGRAEPLEAVLPSEKAKRELEKWEEQRKQQALEAKAREADRALPKEATGAWGQSQQARRPKVERVQLSKEERDEIDRLFSEFAAVEAEPLSQEALPASEPSKSRRERLEKAKALAAGAEVAKVEVQQDRRTARERQLDEEEAEEKKRRDLRILGELRALTLTRRGEPTKFEQAAGEVYCWWKLPSEISGRDVRVKASQGGAHLTVTVRDVVIFDRALFDQIRGDDIIWSVEDSELHLTLTKGTRSKLWEQLGETGDLKAQIQAGWDIPESMAPADRVDKFRQMVTGDDGHQVAYEEMDAEGRLLVDTLRRYQHARATGDSQALAEAEMDLEEFGKFVI